MTLVQDQGLSPQTLGTTTLGHEVDLEDIPVRGRLPGWLNGILLRNGPARFEAGDQPVGHWFDGMAMLHRFGIADGRVCYSNRYLRTRAFAASTEGRIGYREFATDPCRTMFNRVASLFVESEMSDNAIINVAKLNERFVALSETPLGVVFDPRTLETLGVDEHPPGHLPTAHPHFDPRTGEMINLAVHLGPRSSYRLYSRNATQRTFGKLHDAIPAYVHSFGLTEHFVVLALGPLRVQPMALALSGRPFIENYRWHAKQPTRFIAIDRRTGKIARRWRGEAAFLFHHINAFEEGNEIVVDVCGYPDAKLIEDFYLERLRAGAPVAESRPRRYHLAMGSDSVEYETLADVDFELPRIHDSQNTKRYRYAWGISRSSTSQFSDTLARLDLNTRSVTRWHKHQCYPGEPIFVPRPGSTAEDDGVVLSVVLDAEHVRSFLLVLDAATMHELARAEAPHHIPFGIHGQFYDTPRG